MEKPTVHVHVITYNDEVILPYLIRHYLSFCEKIYLYDNGSTDSTNDIVSHYDNVFIESFDTQGQFSELKLLDIKNNCWKRDKADLAIVCDADEFLYHPNMVRFLKRFVSSGFTIAKSCGFDMFSEQIPTTTGQIYEQAMKAQRRPDYDKMFLFNPNKISDLNYDPGCHTAVPEGEVKLYRNDLSLKLLHYKGLSLNYVLERHRTAFTRLSAKNVENKWGIQYFKEYEQKYIDNFNDQLMNGEVLTF